MKHKGLKISLFFIFILSGLFFYLFIFYQRTCANKVLTNLFLGNQNLKGLTKEEVRNFLEEKIAMIEREGVKIFFKKEEMILYPVVIALSDPDLTRRIIHFKPEETIEEIFLWPQKISFLAKWREVGQKRITLALDLNEDEVLKILKRNFSSLEKPSQDASLKYETGQWKIIPEKEGFSFNYQKVLESLKENLSQFNLEPVEIETVSLKPQIYQKDIEFSLSEAGKIAALAPIFLSYGKEKWTITEEILKKWINFKKEEGKISFDLDQEKISEFLEKIAQEIDRSVQEAKFKMIKERVLEFQVSQEGRKLKIEENAKKIKEYVFLKFKEIEFEIETIKPSVLIGDINELGIKELVGRGESDFKGSPKNRIHNITVGAQTLNGILIKPGEEFSLLNALGETSEEKGYLPELVIKGDRTTPELGGGLCQIGTTTFRVALNAGVAITQRTPHAFRVIYYEPAGMDATIYNPSPDFRFVNDYSSWLLLQTRIEGTKLIFELYGTSDGRQVEISPAKIFNVISPGPARYIETEELAPGEKKKVEKPVPGADTEFTRIITWPDGQEKEAALKGEPRQRREIWKSRYKPWPEVWLVGKEPTREEMTPSEENKNTMEIQQ